MKANFFAATSVAVIMTVSTTAHAQISTETSGQDSAEAAESTSAQDIVVTARKRTESLQDVPMSIAVLGGETVQAKAITTFDNLATVASGVTVQRGANNVATFFVRGLGTGPGADVFEQSVALFIDGTYAGRQAEYNQPLFDTERVEIIKGTQASLLAKNTSLGAVSVTTRKPGSDFAFNGLTSYELALGSHLLEGGVDVPFSDTLAVRFSGQTLLQKGWVTNTLNGDKYIRTNSLAGRAVAQWRPTDTLDVTLLYQQYRTEVLGSAEEYVLDRLGEARSRAESAGFFGFETNLNRRLASDDDLIDQNNERNTGRRAIATINYSLGDYTLTSVSAYSKFLQDRQFDNDVLPGTWITAYPLSNGNRQFTQELRLTSPGERPFNFVAGLFFLNEKWFYDRTVASSRGSLPPAQVPLTGAIAENFDQKTTTFSGFVQANYDITDALTVSVGLRGTSEKREASFFRETIEPGPFASVLYPPIAPTNRSFTATNLDGSIGAQYKLNSDALIYASFARGTKGGGFFNSPTSADTARFRPEVADTWEVGTKLSFGRSFFNLALFQTDISDFQNYLFNGLTYDSPPLDLRARGVEAEGRLQVNDNLRLSGAVTYLDAKRGIDVSNRFNDHTRPVNAPKWNGNVNLGYENGVGADLLFSADVGVQFKSSVFYNTPFATLGVGPVANSAIVSKGESYGLVDARLAIGADDGSWQVAVVGKNLLDRTYIAYARQGSLIPGASLGVANMPRTVALQFIVKR